ncbi:hypothetical protein [Microbacterium aerolatum]|uniref:hypothetical protein n=1 Tax=Microbacterium aerolatum TaxID=153731 RepID=UPI00384E7E3B
MEFDIEHSPGANALVYLAAERDPFGEAELQPVAAVDLHRRDLPQFRIGLRGDEELVWYVGDTGVLVEQLVGLARDCVAGVEAMTR